VYIFVIIQYIVMIIRPKCDYITKNANRIYDFGYQSDDWRKILKQVLDYNNSLYSCL
jgi:hypothetical protein